MTESPIRCNKCGGGKVRVSASSYTRVYDWTGSTYEVVESNGWVWKPMCASCDELFSNDDIDMFEKLSSTDS